MRRILLLLLAVTLMGAITPLPARALVSLPPAVPLAVTPHWTPVPENLEG